MVTTAINDPIVMPGSSDGGAHLASFTGADYTTNLLSDWVPDVISLEQAIWRNTLMPATVHGITDRGVLREGACADVLVIDPSSPEGESRAIWRGTSRPTPSATSSTPRAMSPPS